MALSTETPKRLPAAALVIAAIVAMLAAGCVSEPEPAAGQDPAAAASGASAATTSAAEVLKPAVNAGFKKAPVESAVRAVLAEPVAPQARSAASIPTDITVLSSLAPVAADPEPLPGPGIQPAQAPESRTPAAAPVSKMLPAVPAPVPKPSPPVAAKSPPAAVPKPLTAPKSTAAKTPAAKTPAAVAPAEEAKPAPEARAPSPALPATPTSSARSVDAAAPSPVAETRLETARGARFELRFPGTGWIYLGDEEGREGIRYETRRYEDNAAVFAMNPETTGEYLLRFQRQNPVSRAIEVSLVRVQVMEAAALSGAAPELASQTAPGTAKAPAPASTAAPTAVIASPSPAAAPVPPTPATPASTTSASPAAPPVLPADMPSDPAALLTLARNELDGKRVQSAIAVLDRYQGLFPHGSDEVLYLYAVSYEQDTPFKNVRKAYEYYKRIRDEYPRSLRWREAADRMAYLERHFFGLR